MNHRIGGICGIAVREQLIPRALQDYVLPRGGLGEELGQGLRIADPHGRPVQTAEPRNHELRAELVTVELGEGEAALAYDTLLEGRGAEAVQAAIFMAGDGERKSVKVRVEHRVSDCRSDVSVKGVASGTGFGSFDGMVYVAQDAQHTEAYQQSRNLVLGGRARILTSPQLEIYADDVKCSHGATVGQMSDEAIYYMRQRGLSEAEAKGLQLTGFVNEVVSRIADGALAGRILDAASENIVRLQQAE